MACDLCLKGFGIQFFSQLLIARAQIDQLGCDAAKDFILSYHECRYLPTRIDVLVFRAFLLFVRSVDVDVFVLNRGYSQAREHTPSVSVGIVAKDDYFVSFRSRLQLGLSVAQRVTHTIFLKLLKLISFFA